MDKIKQRRFIVEQTRAIRIRNRNYAPGRFINFANRERYIRSKLEG